MDSTEAVLGTLAKTSLTALQDRVAAMPGRYAQMLIQAAKMLEPELQDVSLPSRTLKTADDVDAWLDQAREILLDKLSKGPILV